MEYNGLFSKSLKCNSNVTSEKFLSLFKCVWLLVRCVHGKWDTASKKHEEVLWTNLQKILKDNSESILYFWAEKNVSAVTDETFILDDIQKV